MLRDLFSLFPAYAGVILRVRMCARLRVPFPRIRGGDPFKHFMGEVEETFSPHMRG